LIEIMDYHGSAYCIYRAYGLESFDVGWISILLAYYNRLFFVFFEFFFKYITQRHIKIAKIETQIQTLSAKNQVLTNSPPTNRNLSLPFTEQKVYSILLPCLHSSSPTSAHSLHQISLSSNNHPIVSRPASEHPI
jgi:hypothetical protein